MKTIKINIYFYLCLILLFTGCTNKETETMDISISDLYSRIDILEQNMEQLVSENELLKNNFNKLKTFDLLAEKVKTYAVAVFHNGDLQGSGIIISEDGFIATAYHVVKKRSENLSILAYDNSFFSANLIAYDERFDLALLKIDVDRVFDFALFGNSDELCISESVMCIGTPLYKENLNSVSLGSVSKFDVAGLSLPKGAQIQFSMMTLDGNSGGPIFNLDGEVIAILQSNTVVNVKGVEDNVIKLPRGIAQGISSDIAKSILEKMMSGQSISYPSLNVHSETFSYFEVSELSKTSNAYASGMREGDIIVMIDNITIQNSDVDFILMQNGYNTGDEVIVTVYRKNSDETLVFNIELTEWKSSN